MASKKMLFVLYTSLASAYDAAQDLQRKGFGPGHVSFFTSENRSKHANVSTLTVADGSNFGALIGALTGLLAWGLTIVSGSRAATAAASTVIGGAIGAGVGILVGAFIGGAAAAAIHAALSANRSEDDTLRIRPGNALLTVCVHTDGIDEAVSILADYRPVDIRYSNAAGHGANKLHADKLRRYAAR